MWVNSFKIRGSIENVLDKIEMAINTISIIPIMVYQQGDSLDQK